MDEYRIRCATVEDEANIMRFLKDNWDANHILATSKVMFEHQHYFNGELSYIIAENLDNKEIEGILGYIIYSEEDSRDAFGVMWKVRSSRYPMLGLKIQKFALDELNVDNLLGIGLNPTTLMMHKRLGMTLGRMKHFYKLGYNGEYKVARIYEEKRNEYSAVFQQLSLIEAHSTEHAEEILKEAEVRIPRKSAKYVKHRYDAHPVYQYRKFEIRDGEKCRGMFIAREISCNGARILRMVDYLGNTDWIKNTGRAWDQIVKEQKYEYIDFYQAGIDDTVMNAAGFVERNEEDKNIIPNYFEPYVACNVDLDYFTSSKEQVVLFKGDGDQDRPRYMK